MYQTVMGWMKRMAAWPGVRALVGPDLRRRVSRVLIDRQYTYTVRNAFAGRTANIDDIATFVAANPVRLRAPLLLVSQVQRSGGTLLS